MEKNEITPPVNILSEPLAGYLPIKTTLANIRIVLETTAPYQLYSGLSEEQQRCGDCLLSILNKPPYQLLECYSKEIRTEEDWNTLYWWHEPPALTGYLGMDMYKESKKLYYRYNADRLPFPELKDGIYNVNLHESMKVLNLLDKNGDSWDTYIWLEKLSLWHCGGKRLASIEHFVQLMK